MKKDIRIDQKEGIDGLRINNEASDRMRIPRVRWIIFLIIILCWMPYIVMSFPGNIAYDTGTCIAYYLNIYRGNVNNPYFQNWLMGIVYDAGAKISNPTLGPTVYCVIQLCLEALLLSEAIAYLYHHIQKAGAVAILTLYCVFPVFPMYAFSMAKDSNFGLAILLYVYLSIRLIEAGRNSEPRKWILICLGFAILLISVLRNHAWFVPALALVVYAFKYSRKRLVILASLAVMLGSGFAAVALSKMLGIPETEIKESMSVPIQSAAYYISVYPDQITDEEKETINAVVNYDAMKLYDPRVADPIKDKTSFTTSSAIRFLKMWAGMIGKHPRTCLVGVIRSIDMYFLPGQQTAYKPHIHLGYELSDERKEQLDLYNRNPYLEKIREIDAFFLRTPGLRLFNTIGLYSWTLIFVALFALFGRREGEMIILAPLLMVLAGCCLAPVNGYYRYAYSMILSLPVASVYILGRRWKQKGA